MAKKSAKKSAGKKSGRSNEILIVNSKMKDLIRSHGFNCSSDVLEGLNVIVHDILVSACGRAKSNGRKTCRAADL